MKKTIILISMTILTLTILSQNYYPLIENDRKWDVLNVNETGGWPPFDTTYLTQRFWTDGDTTINSELYSKVYSTTEEIPTNWEIWCFMREDSNKQVWLRRPSDEIDYLMYDFTIESGDSILVGYFEPVYIFLDSTSIEIIEQEERKKYWFSCKARPYYHETWIEGIGSDKGICWSGSASVVGGWFRLLCMSESQELVYSNPYYETCYLITGINDFEESKINIYPNPTTDFIIIENNKRIEINSISLTNINGQIIKQFDSRDTQLDISEFSSGIYFLKLSCEIGELNKKIIIE